MLPRAPLAWFAVLALGSATAFATLARCSAEGAGSQSPAPGAGDAASIPAPAPVGVPVGDGSRPHVLVTQDQLRALQGRAKQVQRLRTAVKASGEPKNPDILLLRTINAGLARHVLGDLSQVARVDELLTYAQRYLKKIDTKSVDELDGFEMPTTLLALAYGYDFCCDDLPDKRRREIAADLAKWGERCAKAVAGPGMWGTDFGNHKPVMLHAAAAAGAALSPDPRAAPILAAAKEQFATRLAPALDLVGGDDGGWSEGISYERKMASSVIGVAESLTNATGIDHWRTSRWLTHNADYILYHLLPNDRFLSIGDVALDRPTESDRLILGRLAGVFKNPHWAGLALKLPSLPDFQDDDLFAGLDLAYVDPDMPTAPLESLPPSKLFAGIGLAIMRSDWSRDAAVLSVRCGPTLSAHQHADEAAFTLFRRGYLAASAGQYDDYWSTHSFNYYRRTIAHNTLTVLDPNEKFPAPKKLAKSGGQYLSNDGGQNLFGAVAGTLAEYQANRTTFDTGRMEAFVSRDRYDYARADASRAYSPDKLKRFVREIVFLRPSGTSADPRVIIIDDVALARPGFVTTWRMHTMLNPTVLARGVSLKGDSPLSLVSLEPSVGINTVDARKSPSSVQGKNFPPEQDRPKGPPSAQWTIELVAKDEGNQPQAPQFRYITALLLGRDAERKAEQVRLDKSVEGVTVIVLGTGPTAEYLVIGRDGAFAAPVPEAPPNARVALTAEDVVSANRTPVTVTFDKAGKGTVNLSGRGPHLLEPAR